MALITLADHTTVDVEPGDFINTTNWFGDVWAEVKSIYAGDRNNAWITYSWHRKDPPANWKLDWDSVHEWLNVGIHSEWKSYQVRKVSKGNPPPKARLIHAATYYTDTEMPANNWFKVLDANEQRKTFFRAVRSPAAGQIETANGTVIGGNYQFRRFSFHIEPSFRRTGLMRPTSYFVKVGKLWIGNAKNITQAKQLAYKHYLSTQKR